MKAEFLKGYRAAAGAAVAKADAKAACEAFLGALDADALSAVKADPWSAGRAFFYTADGNGNWFARDFGAAAATLAKLARGEA